MADDYDTEHFEEVLKRGQAALDRSREVLSRPSGAQAAWDSFNATIEEFRRQNAERFALNQKIRADIHDSLNADLEKLRRQSADVHDRFMEALDGGLKKRHEADARVIERLPNNAPVNEVNGTAGNLKEGRTGETQSTTEHPGERPGKIPEGETASDDKGNPALLAGKECVSFRTAERYLGISEKQRQNLQRRCVLEVVGGGQNRQITVASLKAYLPPRKPELTRTDPN